MHEQFAPFLEEKRPGEKKDNAPGPAEPVGILAEKKGRGMGLPRPLANWVPPVALVLSRGVPERTNHDKGPKPPK